MDIGIATDVAGCKAVFDNAQLALQFMGVLAGKADPQTFIDLVHKMVPSSHAVEVAKHLLTACMGQPS